MVYTTCNIPASDPDNARSVQLAQLAAIECLMKTSAQQNEHFVKLLKDQHSETIDAIKHIESGNSYFDYLAYFFLSSFIIFIISEVKSVCVYYLYLKSKSCAEMFLLYNDFARKFISSRPTYVSVEDFRQSLTMPKSIKCFTCLGCCNQDVNIV